MRRTIILLTILFTLGGCVHTSVCPTNNRNYFYKKMGVKRGGGSTALYKNRGRASGKAAFIVPYKYRNGIPNYGKLK